MRLPTNHLIGWTTSRLLRGRDSGLASWSFLGLTLFASSAGAQGPGAGLAEPSVHQGTTTSARSAVVEAAPSHIVSLVNLEADRQSPSEYALWLERELDHLVVALDALALEPATLLVELSNPPGGQHLSGPLRGAMRIFDDTAWRAEYFRAVATISSRISRRSEVWGFDILSEPAAKSDAFVRTTWNSIATQAGALVNRSAPTVRVVVEPLHGSLSELLDSEEPPGSGLDLLVHGVVPSERLLEAVAKARREGADPLRSFEFGEYAEGFARWRARHGATTILAGRRALAPVDGGESGLVLRERMRAELGLASPAHALVGRPLNSAASVELVSIESAESRALAGLDDMRPEWMPLLRNPRRVLPQPVDPGNQPPLLDESWNDSWVPLADGKSDDGAASDTVAGEALASRPSPSTRIDNGDPRDGVARAAQRFGVSSVAAVEGLVFSPSTVLVKWRHDDAETYRHSVRAMVGDGAHFAFGEDERAEMLAVRVPVHVAMERLRPWVEHVEPDMELHLAQGGVPVLEPNDALYSRQYGLHTLGAWVPASNLTWFETVPNADINAPQGWHHSTGSEAVEIAVIDTGIYDHVDFYAVDNGNPNLPLEQRPRNSAISNLWTNSTEIAGNGIDDDGNGLVDDVRGWDFRDSDGNPFESERHGTRVAGIVGAMGGNGGPGLSQSRGVTGVAWRCKIVPLRAFDTNSLNSIVSVLIPALEYAKQKQFEVVNCSWGATGVEGDFTTLRDTLASMQTSAANPRGQLIVVSAGNQNINLDSADADPTTGGVQKVYPACFTLANVLTVGAVDHRLERWRDFQPQTNVVVAGSNYGATSVDLFAPGVAVWGLAPGVSTLGPHYGMYTSSGNGTSYAAPHVAGAAALLWAQNPGWSYDLVRDRLKSRARAVPALAGLSTTAGLLDIGAALGLGGVVPPQVAIIDPPTTTSRIAGTPVNFAMTVAGANVGLPDIFWTSDTVGGQLSSGALAFSTATLPVGTHNIVAWARGDGGYGLTGSATRIVQVTAAAVPAAPTGLSVVAITGGWRLTWSDNSSGAASETSFEVQRRKRVGATWTQSTPLWAAANDESIDDFPGAGTYQYRVRARNSSTPSAWTPFVATN